MSWNRRKKSPGEALRARLADRAAAKPPLDKELIRFWAALNRVARERFAARAQGEEAEPFVRRLFERFTREAGAGDPQSWLVAHLENQFLSVYEPPRWIGDEPSWPFLNGQPMVFIYQVPLAENEVTRGHLTCETVLYIFGARLPCEGGFEVEYRVVEQLNLQTESQHIDGEMPSPLSPPER